ncbi:MAG: C-type lectin domain-containing protein, partial [Myxococcota bacterium]|nr:C-type lectin domain-containing protein [Myxococcota bacterium]
SHPSKRYVYQAKQDTPDNAKQTCAALGGRLVVLQSRDEREQLWHELSHLTVAPSALWIGLAQVSAGSARVSASWAWDDSTPADGPDAYPSVWGDHQPVQPSAIAPPTTLTTRAFLWHQQPPGIDETLARNDQALTELPFVCEITASTRDR